MSIGIGCAMISLKKSSPSSIVDRSVERHIVAGISGKGEADGRLKR